MTKKLLAVLLAMLMLCGLFAVGASADLDPFRHELNVIHGEISAKCVRRLMYSPDHVACQLNKLRGNENAIKSGKKLQEFQDAYYAATDNMAEWNIIEDFLRDEAKLRAALADGTLREKLDVLYNAYGDAMIAIEEALASEYFVDGVMAFAKAYTEHEWLLNAANDADLPEDTRAEVNEKVGSISWVKVNAAWDEGNFDEATRLLKGLSDDLEQLLAEYGIITISNPEPEPDPGDAPPEPSFFAKLWNFILKWFLFGWIWMK